MSHPAVQGSNRVYPTLIMSLPLSTGFTPVKRGGIFSLNLGCPRVVFSYNSDTSTILLVAPQVKELGAHSCSTFYKTGVLLF
jgi:hypothetical protein